MNNKNKILRSKLIGNIKFNKIIIYLKIFKINVRIVRSTNSVPVITKNIIFLKTK